MISNILSALPCCITCRNSVVVGLQNLFVFQSALCPESHDVPHQMPLFLRACTRACSRKPGLTKKVDKRCHDSNYPWLEVMGFCPARSRKYPCWLRSAPPGIRMEPATKMNNKTTTNWEKTQTGMRPGGGGHLNSHVLQVTSLHLLIPNTTITYIPKLFFFFKTPHTLILSKALHTLYPPLKLIMAKNPSVWLTCMKE